MLLKALNDALLERKVDTQYVTLLVGLWQARASTLTLANAGSVPPLICREGNIIRPHIGGVPLGLLEDREYDEVTIPVQVGDVIVLYSDGVQDQQNLTEEEYGKCRLSQLIKQVSAQPAQGIADAILADLEQYKQDGVVADDQTVIVMKVS